MIGTQVGQYKILEEAGRGGMGIVYRARQLSLGRDVALKVLHSHHALDPTSLERFQREGAAVAGVAHPNIIQIFDVGEEHGLHFIAMELVEGRTVSDILKSDGAFDFAKAVTVCSQIASALSAIHKVGLVHRDIKPSNIIVNQSLTAKLGDFGVAMLVDQPEGYRLTMTQAAVGTPYYMSPEQVRGREALDGSSDVYSLGVVLYEMLVGKHPFGNLSPSEAMIHQVNDPFPPIRRFCPAIPDDLELLIRRCLAKDKLERFVDGAGLHKAIEQARIRLEILELEDPQLDLSGEYRSRVTGTGYFYVDPSTSKRGRSLLTIRAFLAELLACIFDPHKKKRSVLEKAYLLSVAQREDYKRKERQLADLAKRRDYHEQKTAQFKKTVQEAIEDGRQDEVSLASEKETYHAQQVLDYGKQIHEFGGQVKESRDKYDELRDKHAQAADELALLDADARRKGRLLPASHSSELARRANIFIKAIKAFLVAGLFSFLAWLAWHEWNDMQTSIPNSKTTPALSRQEDSAPKTPAPVTSDINLQKGLIAHWPLNGNADDISRNHLNGTVHNAVPTKDRFGNDDGAYYFNGKNAFIDVGDIETLDLKDRSMTISAWIKTSASGEHFIVSKLLRRHPYRGYRMSTYGNDSGRTTAIFDVKVKYPVLQTYVEGGTSVDDDEWHHICGMINVQKKELSLYIDAAWEASAKFSHSGKVDSTGIKFYIGGQDSNNDPCFLGAIDDVRVYNRPLSVAEVKALYEGAHSN